MFSCKTEKKIHNIIDLFEKLTNIFQVNFHKSTI